MLEMLQRKILLEKWQREGKGSIMFFYCSARKLAEQIKSHLNCVRNLSHPASGRNDGKTGSKRVLFSKMSTGEINT